MNFGLSEEQESLQRAAREFLDHECPPTLVREISGEADAFSRRLHGKMAELGWTGMVIPETFGGLGLGTLDLLLLLEEMGRAALPGPFVSSSVLAATALRKAPAAVKKRWLPAIAGGGAVGTIAFLEESDCPGAAGIQARARHRRDHYQLNGVKMFVGDAAAADFIVAALRTSGKGEDGISLFVVEKETPGLQIRPLDCIDVTRRLYRVELAGVSVPEAQRIGDEGKAWPLLTALLDLGAAAVAADSLGGAQRLLDMSVSYSKIREQFGKPIGSFQAVKHMAAEMAAAIEPARSLVWYAGYRLDSAPRQAPEAVAMAKARLSDVYSFVADRALQVHGGIGFTWEHDLHFWFKRAAANRVAFGDPTHHRERVAQLSRFA